MPWNCRQIWFDGGKNRWNGGNVEPWQGETGIVTLEHLVRDRSSKTSKGTSFRAKLDVDLNSVSNASLFLFYLTVNAESGKKGKKIHRFWSSPVIDSARTSFARENLSPHRRTAALSVPLWQRSEFQNHEKINGEKDQRARTKEPGCIWSSFELKMTAGR